MWTLTNCQSDLSAGNYAGMHNCLMNPWSVLLISLSSRSRSRPALSKLSCMLDYDQCLWKLVSAGALASCACPASMSTACQSKHFLVCNHTLLCVYWWWCRTSARMHWSYVKLNLHAAALCVYPWHCRWATRRFHMVGLTRTCHGNLISYQIKRGCWFG